MDLPGYIKDFLQMNYYIPAEELALPFDQMPAYLRELITTKCMDLAENGEMFPKSEEGILNEARKQFQSDIDSDVTNSQDSQVNNFVAHHQKLTELIAAAEKHEKNLLDFSKAAVLLAAKRMASDEYADTPKTLDNFLQVKEEIATELQIKYFTARYFETHKLNPENADTFHEKTLEDIAVISEMVQSGRADQIAARFNLPDTKEAQDAAKGATLSFAGAELKTFADKVEKRIKDSPFVKSVNNLNDSFQKKYPKSYMAAKLVGNTAAAITLGPAFSAYKAVAGINAMRKDFAKFKNENPDKKGRFWKFIASKEGRKKLLEVSQNTVRIIPGMRAVGIALSAVKNSANLKGSLQDLKKNGFNKRTMVKVGIAAAGLLAVSVTAAYANDEVADMVNDCISNTFGSVRDSVENVIDSLQNTAPAMDMPAMTADIDLNEATSSLNDIAVDPVNDLPDPLQSPEVEMETTEIAEQPTVTTPEPQTTEAPEQPTATRPEPQTTEAPEQPTATTPEPQTTEAPEQPTATTPEPQTTEAPEQPTATTPEPQTTEAPEQPTATRPEPQTTEAPEQPTATTPEPQTTEAPEQPKVTTPEPQTTENIQTQDQPTTAADLVGGKEYSTFGDRNMLVQSPDGSNSILFGDGTQKVTYQFSEGKISISAQGFSTASLTEQDAATYNSLLNQAQESGSAHPAFDAQHAFHKIKIAEAIKAQYAANPTPELEQQFEALSMTHRLGMNRLDLGNITDNPAELNVIPDSTIQASAAEYLQQNNSQESLTATVVNAPAEGQTATASMDFDTQSQSMSATIHHDNGNSTTINTNRFGATATHNTDEGYSQVNVGKDGKIGLQGRISRDVDPTKEGVTATYVKYDTQDGSAKTILTDNQTGRNVHLSHDSTGEQVGLYSDHDSKSIKLTHDSEGFNAKGHAFKTKIGDTEVSNADFDLRNQSAGATIHHDNGNSTTINTNRFGATATHNTDEGYSQVNVGKDGKIGLQGRISRDVDPTKEGVTATYVKYDTQDGSAKTILTDNQTGRNVHLSHDSTGEQVGLYSDHDSKSIKLTHDSEGFNAKGHAFKTKIGDTEVSNADFDLRNQSAGATIHHDNGNSTTINTNRFGATATHNTDEGYSQVNVGKDGKIGLQGRISRDVDPTKEGVTATYVKYDTQDGSAKTILTDNQTGRNVHLSHDSTGEQVGLYSDHDSKSIKLTHDSEGFNAKGHAFKTKIGDTEVSNADFDLRNQSAGATIHHDNGNSTTINTNRFGATATHNTDEGYSQVNVGKDGKIGLQGRISRAADPTKEGVTATYVKYDTQDGSVKTVLTDNQTGRNVHLSHDSTGEQVGLYSDHDSKSIKLTHDSEGFNAKGHAFKTKIGDTEVSNADFDLRNQSAGATIHHDNGNSTTINTNRFGATATHNTDEGYSQVNVGKDGKIGLQGRISRAADPTKEGVTATYVKYDTQDGSVKTVLTDNQTGRNVSLSRDKSGIQISTESNGQTNAKVTIDSSGINIQGKSGRKVNVGKVIGFIKGLTR